MSFAAPFFFLLLPVLLLVFFYKWKWQRKKSASLLYSSLKDFKTEALSLRVLLSYLARVALYASLVFLILALARPQKANKKVKKTAEGIDIMIALDVSDSMLIEDMKPENRMESSKLTIKQFIEKRVSDRIGLVVFAGESFTRVPLTLDYPLLQESLAQVKTTRTIKMGTAIGVALANAVGRLRDSDAKSKVVIFLTDGENNSGTIDPLTALEIAKKFGVKIYSIGMGVDGQARLPYQISIRGNQKIKRYRPIHSKVNVELLNKMAEETGGRFYRATTGKGLDEVFQEIDQLEKVEIEVNEYVQHEELFPWFLKIAFSLYLLYFLLEKFLVVRGPY